MASENGGKNIMYSLSLIGFFGIFSTTISKNPVLPLFAHSMGASGSLLGTIAAVSPLAGILFSFPVGYFSDILGRKRLLLIAAAFFLFSPLLYLFVSDPWFLIPVRFIHGMATAILGPVASAVILSCYGENKGEKIGIYSSVTLMGRTLAPLAGGFIITAFAALGGLASYRLVYVAAFLASVPVFVLALFFRDIPCEVPAGKQATAAALLRAFKEFSANRALSATALAEMATYFSFGVIETYLPLYLSGIGVSAQRIGFIFSLQVLSIALTKPFFGRLADRFDKRLQIVFGLVCLGLSAAVFPLLSNYLPLLAVGVLYGVGMSFCTVATSTYTADVARREHLGAAMGALSSIMDIGHSSGPFITGFIITALSLRAGFSFCMFLSVLVAVYFSVVVFSPQKFPRQE